MANTATTNTDISASKEILHRLIATALSAAHPRDAIRSTISLLPSTTANVLSSRPSSSSSNATATSTLLVPQAEASPTTLQIGSHTIPLQDIQEIILLAAGKAASSMVEATIDALTVPEEASSSTSSSSSSSFTTIVPVRGIVVTKYNHIDNSLRTQLQRCASSVSLGIYEAGHPTPDEKGMEGAQLMLTFLDDCRLGSSSAFSRTLVLVLLSGGGSALLPLPPSHSLSSTDHTVTVPDITLNDIIALTNSLLACGATIDEINCVRKHLSRISGGRVAERTQTSYACITLALSDVIGDRPDVIASGPTVPDPTTYGDALDILQRYNLIDTNSTNGVPSSILQYLTLGHQGLVPESPKSVPVNNHFMLIGGNTAAVQRIATEVSQIHSISRPMVRYHPFILTSALYGEATEVSKVLGSFVQGIITMNNSSVSSPYTLTLPLAIICGGETTVTLAQKNRTGKGGRNMELALALALTLSTLLPPSNTVPYTVCSLGTDGTDGPTDAAGAYITKNTIPLALKHNLVPRKFLEHHDSYTFFTELNEAMHRVRSSMEVPTTFSAPSTVSSSSFSSIILEDGGLIRTGPTGTNVMDIVVLLIG